MNHREIVPINDGGRNERRISETNYVDQTLHAGNAEIPALLDEQEPSLLTVQDFSELQRNLREFYKELTLPCIAWLNEAEDLNIDEFYIDLVLEDSGKTINKEDIFNPVNQQRPTRILLEGQPGSGKTSVATRITYDWANEEEYVDQFQLVFLIPLRELQQRSIDDAIKSISNIYGFKDKIDEIIASNEEKILFIFDGLDELSVEDRTSTLELLYKQKYREATILVTCRTGLFTLTKDERKHLFKGMNMQCKFYNKQISIQGIKNNKKKMELLKKFIVIDDSVRQNVVSNLKSTVSATELFDCPLFLILLAFIVNTEEEEETVGIFLTQTELYKKLFNCIIKHSCGRNQIPLDDCFDLFDCESSSTDLRKLIKEFGKLSFKHILENDLQFKSDSLSDQIYKVGFLCNHKQVFRFKLTQYYEAFHLSILEFSAAYYAWMEYKSNVPEIKKQVFEPVVKHYLRSRGTSLVLAVMIGLFQEHSCDIFDCMQPFSSCFSLNFDYIAQLMEELPSADVYEKVFPFLIYFFPGHLDLRIKFDSSMLLEEPFKKLIEYGIKCGKIKSVYGYDSIRTLCLKNVRPPILKIFLGEIEELLYDNSTNLRCDANELHIEIDSRQRNITQRCTVNELLRIGPIIASFKSETLKFHCFVSSVDNNQICVPFEELFVFESPVHLFSFEIRTHVDIMLVTTLLQKIQVTVLHVCLLSSGLDLSDMLHAIANSSSLLYVMFCNNDVNGNSLIDLSDVTNGGTKKYEYLEFDNCIVNCRLPLINRNCVNILSIDGVSTETLCKIEPTNLVCMSSNVKELLETNPTWPGVNSIKYLNISESYECEIEVKCMLDFLSTFSNLRTLELNFSLYEDTETLVEGLKRLAIDKFAYTFESFEELNLFKSLNDNKVKLQSIDIIYDPRSAGTHTRISSFFTPEFKCDPLDDRSDILSSMSELVKGLKQRHWRKVNFVCRGHVDWFLSLLTDKSVIDVSIFNVVHFTYGSNSDDPEYYKCLFNQHTFENHNAFAITVK